MHTKFDVRYSESTRTSKTATAGLTAGKDNHSSSGSWRKKTWQDLEGEEWNEALSESPFIEAQGDLFVHLLEEFGGYYEHIPTPRTQVFTRLAERFFPIHQHYRWYPPIGSKMFDGYDTGKAFLHELRSAGGSSFAKLLLKLGLNSSPLDETTSKISLVLPTSRQALLLIDQPREGDRRYERIPWLAVVIRPPFTTGKSEWDALANKAWSTAWANS